MPVLPDNPYGSTGRSYGTVKYDYDYPDNLDLRPNSETHEKLKRMVLERAQASHRDMSPRFNTWNKIDEKLTAYIPLDEVERQVKDKDERKPVSIVIPMTFATMETILTYMVTTFLQDLIFRYNPVGPEDALGVKLLERHIDLQSKRLRHAINLHTHWRDSICYGFGVVSPVWEVQETTRRVSRPVEIFSSLFGESFFPGAEEEVEERVLLHEGNRLVNISPYAYLPDPNVAIHDVQKGEFVGWIDRDNVMNLLGREDQGEFFNVKYLKHIGHKRSSVATNATLSSQKTDRDARPSVGGLWSVDANVTGTNPVDIIYMYINLVPKDFNLGPKEVPEKWFFALAADEVLIAAQPMNINHGMFPVAVCAPDFDGYSNNPVSKLEIAFGMQETIDWLFSSHITNVRKAINDMFVVDPSLINMQDLKNPKPGMLVRLRPSAWGRGAKDAITQLTVNDITANNIRDTVYLADMLQRTTGATDSLQGILRQTSERRSATEVRDTRSSALSRLQRMAMMISMQSHQDIAMQMAFNTQQFLSETAYVEAMGRWGEDLAMEYQLQTFNGRVPVSARDLQVNFDVTPMDGSMNSGEFSQDWIQLYQIVASNPELLQQFDTVRIFTHIARLLGANNTRDFERQRPVQPVVAPDDQVASAAQAGNLIPLEGLNGIAR